MAFRAYDSAEEIPIYGDNELPDDCRPDTFFAGDRVGPPVKVRRRHPIRRAAFIITVVGGGAFAMAHDPEGWKARAAVLFEAAMRLSPTPDIDQMAATASGMAPPPPIAETREIAAVPSADAGTPLPEGVNRAAPPDSAMEQSATGETASEDQAAEPQPLPPPVVDPADPYQKRALAAGLHPELSRAVLSRLSDADYSNAGVAIKRALAETPDSATFAWPKGGGGQQALFEVHFVRGISPQCRRYVVTLTKLRWSTTALPMETCGIRAPGETAKAVRAGVQ